MSSVDQASPTGDLSSGRSLRNAAVYAAAAAFQKVLGFLLLPLYTHALSPSEYGRLGVIVTITTAATILFSFGQEYALFRGFFQLAGDTSGQRALVDSIWTFLIAASLALAGVISVVTVPWLSPDAIIRPAELVVGLVGAALFVSAMTVPLSLLRAQQRLRDYLVFNAIAATATAGFTITLVVGFGAGVRGWLLAVLLANATAFVAAALIVPLRRPRPFDRRRLRVALVFGLPLVPHFLAHWALQLADRAVLAGLVSTSAVGVYTLAATLSLPALVLVSSISQGFMNTYAAAATSEHERLRLPGVVTVHAVVVLMLCLAIALIGPCLVSFVAPANYSGATSLIPWLTLGYAFFGLYCIPMNGLSLGLGRTQFVWIATTGAAVTNVALVYLLVPAYGIEAAAIASAIGYLVLLLAVGWHSRDPHNPVSYEWSRLLRAVAVVAVVYAAAILTTSPTGIVEPLLRVMWVALAGVGLIITGSVPAGRLRTLAARWLS